jgi:hypothetical protein
VAPEPEAASLRAAGREVAVSLTIRVRIWCEGCQMHEDVDVPLEGKNPHKLRANMESGCLPDGWKLRVRTTPDSRRKKSTTELTVWCPTCTGKKGI